MQVKRVHRQRSLLHRPTNLSGQRSNQMLDLILLALGLGFFIVTIGYAYACDQL